MKTAWAVWAVLAVLAVLALLLPGRATENFEPNKQIPAKTVWLLWLQGWDQAPELIKEVRDSWTRLNPDWNVELVTRATLPRYVDIPYIHEGIHDAALSDIVRLSLLEAHGGVWADATLLCMAPLDAWIHDAMKPTGVWMYHGRDNGTGPCSWFLATNAPHTPVMSKWKRACDEYWTGRDEMHDYFWMDQLFAELLRDDPAFAAEWARVPYMYSEAVGQSHMVAGKTLDPATPAMRKIFDEKPPFVLKLSHHRTHSLRGDPAYALSAMKAALDAAKTVDPRRPKFLHAMAPARAAIVSACKNPKDISDLKDICASHGVKLIVFDKCGGCPDVLRLSTKCTPLDNFGREQHTFLKYVIDNYDSLPDEIFLVPAPIQNDDRAGKLKRMLKDVNYRGKCTTLGETAELAEYAQEEYEGNKMTLADTRPFKAWFEKNVGEWKEDALGPCWKGITRTTRDRVRRRSLESYRNILSQFRTTHDEVGHFMERSMAAVFG